MVSIHVSVRLPRRFRVSASLALVAMVSSAAAACLSNPTKDSHCTPDARSIADDPECIYAGDGKGPVFVEDACAAPHVAKPASCAGLFVKVFDMMTDATRGNCAATSCHGYEPNAASGIYFDSGDPQSAYQELVSVSGSVGTPYVVADDPSSADNEAFASWMPCNVSGMHGGGFPMPPAAGLATQADADLVSQWIACGAPGP